MVELILPIALGASTFGLAALCALLGFSLQSARGETGAARDELYGALKETSTVREALDHAQDEVRRLEAALTRLHQDQQRQEAAAEKAATTLRNAQRANEDRLVAVMQERDRATDTLEALRAQQKRLTTDLESARRDASTAQQEQKRLDRTLTALALDVRAPRDPLAPDQRVSTRAMLRRLVASSASDAVVLADGRGLCAFAAGRDAAVDRLASVAALADGLEPYFGAVLCAPIAGVSVSGLRFADHLLRLHGTPWFLGAETHGEAPLIALRHARLALTGAPVPPKPVPALPEHVIDLSGAPDALLTGTLGEWARRWSAQTATVLGPDTRPLATLRGADPGAAMGLRQQLHALMVRAHRDREPLDTLIISAWAEDDTTVQIVLTHADLDTAAVVSVSRAPLPEEALEEIRATVRWHLNATPLHAREAS